jgi:hypothetical protein
MPHAQKAPMSGSLRAAKTAVEIVWYLTWGLTTVAALGSVVFALAPGTRTALVTRGVLTEEVTETLPFKVRYGASDSVLSPRHQLESLGIRPGTPDATPPAPGTMPRLMGHNDVVMGREMTTGLLGGAILSALLTGGLLLWTLHQLRMLVRTVSRGAPFDPANPVRIRRIGWIVLAYGPLSGLLGFVESAALLTDVSAAVKQAFPDASVGVGLNLNLATVIVGLIILAIAEAFEAGVRLQQEQDLTV